MNVSVSSGSRVFLMSVFLVSMAVFPQAHTKLEKSEPAAGATLTTAPRQIRLWFNETIDPAVSKIEVTSNSRTVAVSGMHVMNGKELMASVTGAVSSGTYTVAWQTAGDDGHVVKGDFSFTVKATTH